MEILFFQVEDIVRTSLPFGGGDVDPDLDNEVDMPDLPNRGNFY